MNKLIKHLQRISDKCRDFSRKAFKAFWGTPSNLTSQVALVVKNMPTQETQETCV